MANSPLAGIRFLFVDDRFEITRPYIKKIETSGGHVEYCTTIGKAHDLLTTNQYDFAVLDLHMFLPNPLPENLKEFSEFFQFQNKTVSERRSLNAGQILGM